MPKFLPGQSGNPKGRPTKDRALTAILERAGNQTVKDSDGKLVARKRLMAQYLWEAATSGEITFPDGKKIVLSPDDFIQIIQFLYKHIDGAPLQKIAPTDPTGENPYMGMEAHELIDIARKVANAGDNSKD